MSRLPPTLLARPLIAIALAAALAVSPLAAQQIPTSHGMRTLPRTDGMKSEQQFRQAARLAEDIVNELLQDIATLESTRQATVSDAEGVAAKVKRESADYERAKTAFDLIDQKYRTDLQSFQQRQTALEADIQRQRGQAATLQALPSAQRDYAEVSRLNDWATQISTQRDALEAERTRLLTDQANVEAERAKLAKQKLDAESRLKGMRDNTVGQYGSVEEKRIAAYRQLRTATNYLREVREQWGAVAKLALPHSIPLDQANEKLRSFEARNPTR